MATCGLSRSCSSLISKPLPLSKGGTNTPNWPFTSFSTSSSSSMFKPADNSWKYDVFLSFKEEDTGKGFASHLHSAFTRHNIRTYIHTGLDRGDEISPSLLKAIEDSKIAVPVFSKNYASDPLCLDELQKIMECKRDRGQRVLPVFYDVTPSQVRHQTGSYLDAFVKHKKRYNMEKNLRWRLAMIEAANLRGWDCSNGLEAELVEKIALDVSGKLGELNNATLGRSITSFQHMAQVKLEKSLRTNSLSDMEDLLATLKTLADLKLQKALRTNNGSDWIDLLATYTRLVDLLKAKFMRLGTMINFLWYKLILIKDEDLKELADFMDHLHHVTSEVQDRKDDSESAD